MKWITYTLLTFATLLSHAELFASDIYKVTRVGQGNSLNMRLYPGSNSRIKVAIPHNASWIVKRNRTKKIGSALWSKVVWNKEEGWVNENFLSFDPVSTQIARQRKECLLDPSVEDKLCCGLTDSERHMPYKHVDILTVQGIETGETLPLRTQPGRWKGKVVVAIPHNATWIARLGEVRKLSNGEVWEHVRWNGQNGWVNRANTVFDQAMTALGDNKRKKCSL